MARPFNVILFGEAGVGKSSSINLLADKEIASASADARGSTLDSHRYTIEIANGIFNVWDTTGFGGPVFRGASADYLDAVEKTRELIQQIEAKGGLGLLLFCIPGSGSRVTQTMLWNYLFFFELLCQGHIPIALVVTHLEREKKMEDWWLRNGEYITLNGLMFSGHACITGLQDHPKRDEGRVALVSLLLYNRNRHNTMPSTFDWYTGFQDRATAISSKESKKNMEQLQCDSEETRAKDVWRKLKQLLPNNADSRHRPEPKVNPPQRIPSLRAEVRQHKRRTGMPSSFNVVLFGEAGVGKSSIINLIADEDVAATAATAWGCTLESQQYTFAVAERTFNVWDTVGLGEPVFSTSDYLGAIEKTHALIQQIETQGGLDLLLFCIPGSGSRITQTMLSNYRLFYEVLCEKRIPIALVVTRLENEEKMEDWWDRNGEYASKVGLMFGGHACVTGWREHPKAAEGRSALELLLLSYDLEGRYPMPPASAWFSGFLERIPTIPRRKSITGKRGEVEKMLRDRCMIDGGVARRLAESLTRTREYDY